MSASQIVAKAARAFPSLSREILTLSVKGRIPAIHRHWFFSSLARDLFAEQGFPMWGCPYRLYIPCELFPIYLDYFNFLDHEPLQRRFVAKLLKPGSVFVDVGANVGYYTLLASWRVGPRGKVHSIECSNTTLALLMNNVRKNNLHNVEVHAVAASDKRGELKLNVSAIGLSLFELPSHWPKVEGSGTAVSVPAAPLDEIIHSRVDVVKIDAEGADLEVLKGMQRILSENREIALIVEWAPPMLQDAGKDPLELPRWLRDAGFRKISALESSSDRRLSLDQAIGMVQSGALPGTWVADLFAQRT